MRGYTPGIAHRRDEATPYVAVWEQSNFWWVVSEVYMVWEKLTWRLFRFIEPWHKAVFEESESYIPLTNRQDIRCDHLQRRGRNTLAVINVTQEQYDVITGKKPKQIEPRPQIKDQVAVQWDQEG